MNKRAFTMIELIVVIVAGGILALLATNILFNIYKSYAISRAVEDLETRTTVAIDQVAKRLSDRVPNTVIGRKHIDDENFEILANVDTNHSIMEWIGQSSISKNLHLKDGRATGWSGYITERSGSYFITPGSDLVRAAEAIKSKTNGTVSDLGIIFIGLGDYSGLGYGFDRDVATKIARANLSLSSADKLYSDYNGSYTYRYYLVDSAYALAEESVTMPDGVEVKNLVLYYDYRPWVDSNIRLYKPASRAKFKKTVLARNIELFRFRGHAKGIDFKLCMRFCPKGKKCFPKDFVVCKNKVLL